MNLKNTIKILRSYYYDAFEFLRFSMYGFSKKHSVANTQYEMLLNIHSIEKGLCIRSRLFGEKKAKLILDDLKYIHSKHDVEWISSLAVNTLESYLSYLENNGYSSLKIYGEIASSLPEIKKSFYYKADIKGGVTTYYPLSMLMESDYSTICRLANSRRSVRTFKDIKVKTVDIEEAISIAIQSPSACNRQMVHFYVSDDSSKQLLQDKIMGFSGFDNSATFGVITFDNSAFNFEGERNQGYLNAGLFAMSLINAFHSKKIGSCFLQWGNNRKDTEEVKAALSISEPEKIVCVLAFGYYQKEYIVPVSSRKPVNTVLHFTGECQNS